MTSAPNATTTAPTIPAATPAEIDTEFFLQMAWDIHRWRRDNLGQFLPEWAGREFGRDAAPEIASIMREYYRLNFQRRPGEP